MQKSFETVWQTTNSQNELNEVHDDLNKMDVMLGMQDIKPLMHLGMDTLFSEGELPNSQDSTMFNPLVDFINDDNRATQELNLDQPIIQGQQSPYLENPMAITNLNEIPTHVSFPGEYNFNIMFEQQPEKPSKSASWTYSEVLDKLFIVNDKNCDIKFVMGTEPPAGSVIRALPIFSKAEHVMEIVRRCPNHSRPSDISNDGHPAPDHLVRCESKTAVYEQCQELGRMSVVVPYVKPQAGTKYSSYLYKFMCYSSCVGGLNRRPIQLVFTLEKDGVTLGRRSMKVRICACPGRDRKTEENHKKSRSLTRQSSITKTASVEQSPAPVGNKRKKVDEEIFCVHVRGRENYEILSKLADSLELTSKMPREKVEASRSDIKKRALSNQCALPLKGGSSRTYVTKIEKDVGKLD